MNKQETVQIISLLAGNYNAISQKSKTEKELMINSWYACLGDLDYDLILQAVKKAMIEIPYPPTIAEIRKNALELTNSMPTVTAIEAWEEAYYMISNGIYMTEEEFNTASPIVKKFFGSVRQVKELAMCSSNEVNTVVKGQFLKQYEILVKREENERLLPQSIKDFTKKLADKMDIKQIGEKNENERLDRK